MTEEDTFNALRRFPMGYELLSRIFTPETTHPIADMDWPAYVALATTINEYHWRVDEFYIALDAYHAINPGDTNVMMDDSPFISRLRLAQDFYDKMKSRSQ